MKQHLDVLYKDCLNYAPRVKRGAIRVLMSLTLSYKGNSLKVFMSKTTRPRALIYAMYNNLVVIYEDL